MFKYFLSISLMLSVSFFLISTPVSAQSSCSLTPLRAYKSSSSPSVWYISADCSKRPIRNPDVFFSHFSSWAEVHIVSSAEIAAIADSPLSFLPWGPRRSYDAGSLIKTVDDPRVYWLRNTGNGFVATPIASETVFTELGFNFDEIEDVIPEVLDSYTKDTALSTVTDYREGTYFQYPNSPMVFELLREGNNWVKRHVQTYDELRAAYRPDRVVVFQESQTFADAGNTTTSPEPSSTPTPPTSNSGNVAFPGAEGWGAQTVGGRGGRVYIVDTLEWNQNLLGSFAHALYATEPRTIVFAVSGVIDVPSNIPELGPEHSYVTIAGQTSPGGITLRGMDNPALWSYNTGARSDADVFHDLIVRHVRFRSRVTSNGFGAVDSLSLAPTYNMIFDHVDFSGGWDETLDIGYSRNVTIQWSTWSNSGSQGYGFLLAYQPTDKITLHHNLSAHHRDRCLAAMHWDSEIPGWGLGGVPSAGVDIDIRNNVVHNCEFPSTLPVYADSNGLVRLNYVGNTVSQGENTPGNRSTGMVWFAGGSQYVRFYEQDNHYANFPVVNLANESSHTTVSTPWSGGPVPVTTQSASAARELVLNQVGAWPRDAMTARIVSETRSGTGAIGTYNDALITSGPSAPVDTDRDGMPDNWERVNGMNVGVNDSALDNDTDGWTNLEEYLHVRAVEVLGNSAPTPTGPQCGNNICESGEDYNSCSADCAAPEPEPVACTLDVRQCSDGSYVSRVAPSCNFAACPTPTGPQCGNNICESGEDYNSCSADCDAPEPTGPMCGDNVCESGETANSCSADCTESTPVADPLEGWDDVGARGSLPQSTYTFDSDDYHTVTVNGSLLSLDTYIQSNFTNFSVFTWHTLLIKDTSSDTYTVVGRHNDCANGWFTSGYSVDTTNCASNQYQYDLSATPASTDTVAICSVNGNDLGQYYCSEISV